MPSPGAASSSGTSGALVRRATIAVAPIQQFVRAYLARLPPLTLQRRPSMFFILKAFAAFIFVLNARAWPFVWHVRIWRWAIWKRLEYRLFRWRTILDKKEVRAQKEDKLVLDSTPSLGASPLEYVSSYRTWASIDESDFNMHLSNSSYAKTLDSARFKLAMETFLIFFRGGGWIPLAATHYHFVCEIPILASYEVRTRVGGWDNKWFYVVSKFVMPASKSKKKRKSPKAVTNPDTMPSLRTPSCSDDVASAAPSGTATPVSSSSPNGLNGLSALNGIKANGTTVTTSTRAEFDEFDVDEPDGAQVHTVAISRCCFKVGRITVPPAVVFAMCGMTADGNKGVTGTSKGKGLPPKHWSQVMSTFSPESAGRKKGEYGTYDPKMINKFMKGGWKEVEDPKDKWWERAFDSVREENEARVRRLEGRV